jgi:hypothetical protein
LIWLFWRWDLRTIYLGWAGLELLPLISTSQVTRITDLSYRPSQKYPFQREHKIAGHQWLTPAVLATWEAEIRRIEV